MIFSSLALSWCVQCLPDRGDSSSAILAWLWPVSSPAAEPPKNPDPEQRR
jgi:hypothetical protein